jgi:hypothetical protein
MPLDIRITTMGKDTNVSVFNNAQQQTFTIKCQSKPSSILLDPDGWILKFSSSENEQPPSSYQLEQNYPNPFNSSTTISYQLPSRGPVILKIFDILGREISTIVNAVQSAGVYEYQWNPQSIASGIFIYRLTAGNVELQRKMVFLK